MIRVGSILATIAVAAFGVPTAIHAQSTPDTSVTITVEDRTNEHPWTGRENAFGEVFAVDGVQGDTLVLHRDSTYHFVMDEVPEIHPFYLSESEVGDGGEIFSDGVSSTLENETDRAWGSDTLTFKPSDSAPDTLYYQCINHRYMGGTLLIEGEEDGDASRLDSIAVVPEDTTVTVESEVQFSASVFDTTGSEVDTTFTWTTGGPNVGSVDSTGLFTATQTGTGFVRASVGDLTGQATVVVEDTTTDTTGTQVVKVIRPKPSPQATPDTIEVQEGGSYTLGGFPHPLQLLNGGVLSFPTGSLTEDIELLIEIEGFATVTDDSVDFPNGVVTGADFTVQIDGEPADSAYTFAEPITLALPFKRGVIKNMGLSPTDLGMFFYDQNESSFIEEGITDVVVDSTENRIFANVAHFTPVVLASETEATPITEDEGAETLPSGFALHANYPNPFNPTTTIRYELPRPAQVSLRVFDALGREVAQLEEGLRRAGTHTVRFEAEGLPSGLYFYRLRAGDHFRATRSMMLLK